MVTVGVAAVLLLLGGGFYYWMSSRRPVEAAPGVALETAASPATPAGEHPYKKHLEIVGYRIFEDAKRKPQIRFLIVNHSGAELDPVNMRVTIETTKAKPGDPAVATLLVKTPRLAAYGSQEFTSALNTKLRAYEIPDWQFLRLEPEITSK
jgi:hypothetical protein